MSDRQMFMLWQRIHGLYRLEVKTLVDYEGNELKIGDKVVYVHGKNSDACLETGYVTKFYKNYFGKDECSVGSAAHILSHRIMKIGE